MKHSCALLSLFLAATYAPTPAATLFPVVCPGTSLAGALRLARPGDTIRIGGSCAEKVIISQDNITIDGLGSGIVDGSALRGAAEFDALVTVDGASGVVIRGIEVRNGSAEGVLVRNGGSATLVDVVASGNGGAGLVVIASSIVEVVGGTFERNGLGIDIVGNSTGVVRGEVSITRNGGGLDLNGSSMLELRGARLDVSDNSGNGIAAGGSHIAIYGFEQSQGSALTTNDNGANGILLADSLLEIAGARFFGSGANVITASGNGASGIWSPAGGRIRSPFATARFVLENNVAGLNLGLGSSAVFVGGLNARLNETAGVTAEGSDLVIISIPPNPSVVTGNGTDVKLGFGSRMTGDGLDVGTLACDDSVLVRGSESCL